MQQKDIFLASEADAWFERNHQACLERDFANDDLVARIVARIVSRVSLHGGGPIKLLEIGCGEGRRLEWLAKNFNIEVYGIEPSAKAVEQACSRGVKAQRGTADTLPFETASFDIVVFGFCLYLCDRQDLFRIACEADRVLKPKAWVIINDFFSSTPMKREYHHKSGMYSYKMDYRTIFDWHPAYTCYEHKLTSHSLGDLIDDPQEWVAISLLRKVTTSNE
ncbi:class I SAM-dependent methyltransferase [Eoetvoesiella caeni]|uniref:class I SAM-dependent methyltransferase n=1 Tax=Eoetvoesiella caeni TaxID=645616 RepID=UPI001472DBD1|nr:class I SAM-dependent methyltransferase [Eoetvoesiella caeni]MCI2807806.1 class I SAM-dependent methyltransferase [Eoetvoesiella caeni]NYT54191.1 class I SAM-dependent methyltransferase [Eoetvoesiella caeni]